MASSNSTRSLSNSLGVFHIGSTEKQTQNSILLVPNALYCFAIRNSGIF